VRAAIVLLLIALFSSCSRKDTAAQDTSASLGPHAVIILRDGGAYPGRVLSSSPTQIKVAGDDNTTRTFDMKDVRSVDYGEPAPLAAQVPRPVATPAPQPSVSEAQVPTPAPRGAVAQAPPPDRPHEDHYHPEESAIRTRTYELPRGTQISIRTEETIDSARAVEGQTFAAEVSRDVRDSAGDIVIPRGSNAQVVIRSASRGGRITNSSDLVLDLASVSVDGRRYRLSTSDILEKGKDGVGGNKRTAKYVGGGAVLGTIIGAIAGQGKGAAIGGLSGAAAGAAGQVFTKGRAVRVPVESVLTFRLDRPLRVSPGR
jgi:hypothetical protein